MYLSNLYISNFKNYTEGTFTFHQNVNCLLGSNGSGKTNLLDAIHYLAFCKSYFTTHDQYSVKFNEEFFAIHGDFTSFEQNHNSTKISCLYKNGRKTMKANNKDYDRLSDHYGLYPLIMVSPYDNDIINEGSETRRKFFDMIIAQSDKEFLQQLIKYHKIITQRNTILKQILNREHNDVSLLQIYNDQLSPTAQFIFSKRQQFLQNIKDNFQKYYEYLSGGKEQVALVYTSQLQDNEFDLGIQEAEAHDIRMGYSTFGIHKDDYQFLINGKPLKRFGSQGQQKSFSLALKLAQYDYVYQMKKIKPLLLLDDIFDKLDRFRIFQLLELVGKHHFGQVFISDTDEIRMQEILNTHQIAHSIFHIKN